MMEGLYRYTPAYCATFGSVLSPEKNTGGRWHFDRHWKTLRTYTFHFFPKYRYWKATSAEKLQNQLMYRFLGKNQIVARRGFLWNAESTKCVESPNLLFIFNPKCLVGSEIAVYRHVFDMFSRIARKHMTWKYSISASWESTGSILGIMFLITLIAFPTNWITLRENVRWWSLGFAAHFEQKKLGKFRRFSEIDFPAVSEGTSSSFLNVECFGRFLLNCCSRQDQNS